MLSNLLGWVVVLGSLGLFLSGFFLPEVRRKNDPIWSGVGLIYALALWVNGDRTPGGLLLGEIASVALLVWFGWQMVQQRRQLAPSDEQTPIPNSLDSLTPFLKAGWGQMQTAYGELSTQVQGYLGQDESDLEPSTPPQPLQKDWADEDEWEDTPSAATPAEPEPTDAPPSAVAEDVPSVVEATPIAEAPVQDTPAEPDISSATVADSPVAPASEEVAPAEAEVPPEPEPVVSAVTVEDVPSAEPEAVHEAEPSEPEAHPSDTVETPSEPSSEETSEQPEASPEASMDTTPSSDAGDDGSWPPPESMT